MGAHLPTPQSVCGATVRLWDGRPGIVQSTYGTDARTMELVVNVGGQVYAGLGLDDVELVAPSE